MTQLPAKGHNSESQATLSHYSSKPLGLIRSVSQAWEDDYRSSCTKPKGLWVSVDGEHDWKAWCESESFGLGGIRHRVTLAEPNTILWIESDEALRAFTKQYGHLDSARTYAQIYIDWPAVAAIHDGIIIAPYQWSCRMNLHWYYGWDCASGCIWNAEAIQGVHQISESEAA